TQTNRSCRAFEMKIKYAVTLLALWLVTTTVTAQSAKQPATPPKKQRVTIEFERFDEVSGKLCLRLRNLTAWDIRIPVEMFFPGEKLTGEVGKLARGHKDGAKAPVRYYLEEFSTNNPAADAKLPPV